MAYGKIRQPKLSDVIEQRLEHLIFEGTLRPAKSCLLNVSWQNSSTFLGHQCVKLSKLLKLKVYYLAAKVAELLFKNRCGKVLATH